MRHPPLPLAQALNWRRGVFAIAALSLLTGCGTLNGDFGEARPTLVDDIHDWIGPYTGAIKPASLSKFELTDDERQLRDLARPLTEPPYTTQPWYSIFAQMGLVKPAREVSDSSTYAKRLLASHYHSPSARYAQLTDDIRNDSTRLPEFFETAGRVLDMDVKRQKSLAYVPSLSPTERKHALQRINENASIVSSVRAKLTRRVTSYRVALGRLAITTPSRQVPDVERAINQLQDQIARYRNPAPTWVREQNLASVR